MPAAALDIMMEQFKNKLNKSSIFKDIEQALKDKHQPEVTGLPGVSRAYFIYELGQILGNSALIVSAEEKNLKLYEDLLFLADKPAQIIYLDEEYAHLRLLQALEKNLPVFCLSAVETLAKKVISPQHYQAFSLSLFAGQWLPLQKLTETLSQGGYNRAAYVEKAGDFSVRGGIVDIFMPLADNPIRLEFNGDLIESLREFETFTQRSLKNLTNITLRPFKEEEEKETSLWQYFKADTLLFWNEIIDSSVSSPPENMFSQLRLTLTRSPQSYLFDFQPMETFHGSLDLLKEKLQKWQQEKYEVYLIADNLGQKERLFELLSPFSSRLPILTGVISGGFISPELKLALVSDEEIFGRYLERKYLSKIKKTKTPALGPFLDLKENDYVVHETYGIGIYEGLKRLIINDKEEDFLSLRYAEGDRLYVPAEQMNLVQKYISVANHSSVRQIKIYRLGGDAWQRVKQQVKESSLEVAKELLNLYSERETVKGLALALNSHWQQEFEAAFIYEETPDQRQAIEMVKKDLAEARPMDRLICGDVGYGKTEVAMRAAFTTADNGKQVAVLVPTTILAEQHFNTFRERFADYPMRIEMLSRFRVQAEQQKIIKDLAQGLVDVIIGTHRLIQPDVKFKNLGLLVVDEEQRFGVGHKEKMKQLCKNIHVLTLSATPIPRTLEMSLSGIRDISIINNPPEGRLPVNTYVTGYDDEVIKNAIEQELKRGGQVFFVHNRVRTISRCMLHLRALVPEAKIQFAHGQMNEKSLERIMLAFVAGKFNVLVATTIIESGLDLPNVNTLIVDDAVKFGLADLYQLRGRVGRSSKRANAYFFYPRNYMFTQEAAQRLKAIQEFSQLGSGFKIAMRDLEMRGAGNLLGKEQSGYISRVGFDLYVKLLAENIQQLKGQSRKIEVVASINLRLKAYIPPGYINDEGQRLEVYKKLAQTSDLTDLEDIKNEIKDRYGAIPLEIINLLEIIHLRVLAQKLFIEEINEQEQFWELIFHPRPNLSGERFVKLSQDLPGQISFQPGPPFSLRVRKGPLAVLKNILQNI